MTVSAAAQQAEINAYRKVKKALGNAEAFAEPAGFETSFPDFGFRVYIDSKPVDIHIEYKADSKAQMGSMRDWIFDGKQFMSNKQDATKEELIFIMNSDEECVKNGKRLLADFKKYFDKRITKIYSGMLTIESDQKVRRAKLKSFAANTKNYSLAKITSDDLGNKILDHYKKKFKKAMRSDAASSILLMMLGNEVYFIDRINTVQNDLKIISDMLSTQPVPTMRNLRASLEVRIQPRGLSAEGKPVSIDVMASFRLAGKTAAGASVR
jgi:hypothetical protein